MVKLLNMNLSSVAWSIQRRVGSLPNGQVVNEIPNATYTGSLLSNDPEFIVIPNASTGVYQVTVTGKQASPFRIAGEVISGTTTTRLGLFTGTLQPGQTATYTTQPFQATPTPRVLLVDDHAGSAVINRYTSALSQIGRTTTVWNTVQQGVPQASDLYPYTTVIWSTGSGATLANSGLAMLGGYASEGGGVLISGQDADAGITSTLVLSETIQSLVQMPSTTSQQAAGADLLAGFALPLNGGDSANNQVTPTALQPFAGTRSLGSYTDGTGVNQVAGIRTTLLRGRLAFLGFGIEGIQTAALRTTVLQRLLTWLETGQEPNPPPTLGLVNGSFEQGLTGWSAMPMSGTIDPSSIAHDGASSTAITGQVLLDQVVTGLVPNTQYTLSTWVQAANGPDNPVWVWISEYGGETLFQGAVDTQGWEQLTHVFQTGPTTTRVRIRIQTPTLGGQALVDHVQLTGPLAPPPPDPPPGSMPGLLEAEDAPSFFDTDTINEGGAYRSDGLDVEACAVCLRTGSAGYNVGWIATGEWLEFPVTFAASGSYKVRVRYTTPDISQLLRVRLNGVDVTGQLALPQTGGWGNWQDVTSAAFSANAGAATIRVELLSDMFNLDMIEIVPAGGN